MVSFPRSFSTPREVRDHGGGVRNSAGRGRHRPARRHPRAGHRSRQAHGRWVAQAHPDIARLHPPAGAGPRARGRRPLGARRAADRRVGGGRHRQEKPRAGVPAPRACEAAEAAVTAGRGHSQGRALRRRGLREESCLLKGTRAPSSSGSSAGTAAPSIRPSRPQERCVARCGRWGRRRS